MICSQCGKSTQEGDVYEQQGLKFYWCLACATSYGRGYAEGAMDYSDPERSLQDSLDEFAFTHGEMLGDIVYNIAYKHLKELQEERRAQNNRA